MKRTTAHPATERAFELAECPVWDASRERLLWVDIDAHLLLEGTIHESTIEVTSSQQFDDAVTAVAAAADGRLAVAVGKSVIEVMPDQSPGRTVSVVPASLDSRLNDGACDAAGRLIIGSKSCTGDAGREFLARIDTDGVTMIDNDLALSNGIAWSPDGSVMYSVDSVPGVIWARAYAAFGAPNAVGVSDARHARTEHIRINDGFPDGLCVDSEGGLWVAIWGRGEVRRFDSSGAMTAVIEVHAPHTSSVAFAGADLSALVITTARADLDAETLAAYPNSGRLFLAHPEVRGMPLNAWQPATFPIVKDKP